MPKKLVYSYVEKYFKNEGYALLSKEYKNSQTKLKYRCLKGHIGKIKFNDFRQGYRCFECMGSKKLDIKFVIDKFKEVRYTLLEKEYRNNSTKMKYRCNKGHLCEITWNSFQQGRGCYICGKKNMARTQKNNYNYVYNYFKKYGYELLAREYKNNKQKLEYKCPFGHINKMRFNDFKSGNRCPNCKISKGETRIKEVLEENNIKFTREKIFKNCKSQRYLPFDFYLPENNILIEYQGEQHYRVFNNNYFGGQNDLEKRQKRDQIKRNFAKKEKIKLVEISYTKFDKIDKILEKELKILELRNVRM